MLKFNLEIDDLQLIKLEDTISFLQQVENLVKSYEESLQTIVNSLENKLEKVCIFDGTKEHTIVDINGMFSISHVQKAKLLNQIKILKQKRQTI